MALTPEQIAQKKAEEAAAAVDKLAKLEALVTRQAEEIRDVTSESIGRKEKIRDLEAKQQERDEAEKKAREVAEAERVKALPQDQRQAAEANILVESFKGLLADTNTRIDGLKASVETNTKESMERTKSAAIEAIVSQLPFHDPTDAKRNIDVDSIPMVNGEPDRAWIAAKVTELAKAKPYLLKPPASTIPNWGGTAPVTLESGPPVVGQEMTPEARGAALLELAKTDPGAAMAQSILGTVDLPPGATKDALSSPTK